MGFLTKGEVNGLGLRRVGRDVLISRKASIYNPESISIGNNVRVDDFSILSGGKVGITLGDYVHISCYVVLFGNSGIYIGDFSGVSSKSAIYSESDDFSGHSMVGPCVSKQFKDSYRYKTGRVSIGRHCVIGTNCTVMPGVNIGEGTAIGAHSLVNRHCQPWSIYYGAPARRKGDRSKQVLKLEAEFWKDMVDKLKGDL
jgi:galactoside O-acetyltransferase